MWAETPRGCERDAGTIRTLRAMTFRQPHAAAPKMKAMGNIGIFSNFLLLVGKGPRESSTCP